MSKLSWWLLAFFWSAGCTRNTEPYQIVALKSMEPGTPAAVSIRGAFEQGTTFLWTATAGRFEGPIDESAAVFVAPATGPVTIQCTIKRGDGKPIVLDMQIQIGMSDSDSSLRPRSDVAAPTTPGGALPTPRGVALPIEDAGFVPAGFMGDVRSLRVDAKSGEHPHPPHTSSQKWSYKPQGGAADTWAAVAWQFPANNFGAKPGRDWSARGFTQVSVWARGIRDRAGKLPKIQFKAGGTTDPTLPNQASFSVEGDFVTLTDEWKEYTLDLKEGGRPVNLSQVVAAFVFVVRAQDVASDGATFYLDDILYR